jgi:hypothetical protein
MRSGLPIPVGILALAGLSVAGVATAQRMMVQDRVIADQVVTDRVLIQAPPIIWFPPPPPPPQAPPVNFRGCVYYEHANWQGKMRSIPGGIHRQFVGDSWNETISSFACNPACRVAAFQDRDFKGARGEFTTTGAVPGEWNDKISSMIAVCRRPW